MAKKKDDGSKTVADNRKARYAYAIDETLEAGIMLVGSEVKSLRGGKSTISESYAFAKDASCFWSTPISPNTPRPAASITSPSASASSWSTSARPPRLSAAIQREA